MKRTTLFALLLILLTSCSQKEASHSTNANTIASSDDISITELGSNKPEDNKFPNVHYKNNNGVEDKINTFLQVENLKHLPGIFKKDPFENISSDMTSGGQSFDSWNQNKTTANILSLTLEETYTGAYTESFQEYYNFDLRTGNNITTSALFTADGWKSITKTANQDVKKQIEDLIARLKDPKEVAKIPEDERGQIEDEIAMYQACLESVMGYPPTRFYFSNDSLVLVKERCSNHADLTLDELMEFHIPFSFKDIKPNLSPYGISLMANDSRVLQAQTPEGKLYKGFINGKYAISAMVPDFTNGEYVEMYYWYDKTKIPIQWSGSVKGNHFSLTETDDSGSESKDIASIEADWVENAKITGTWTNDKTKEVMKLELQAY